MCQYMDMKTSFPGGSYEIPVIKTCDITAIGLLCASDYGQAGAAATGFSESNTITYTDTF